MNSPLHSKLSFALFCALPVLLTLASCDKESDVERANRDRIFLYGNSAEPQGLDPHMVSGVTESKILTGLFEGLVADSATSDTEMMPGVAKRWESNPAATEWIFHLRKNAVWSDGESVTAEDFAFSYERILTPALGAKYAEMLYFIKNAEEYNQTHLGYILCGLDPEFPLPWEALKAINFRSNKSIDVSEINKKVESGATLSVKEQKQLNLSAGLDNLPLDELKAMRGNPAARFTFPESIPTDVRLVVLDRLIEWHEQGSPDLWERAQVGIEALDDYTLKITCKESVPFLPSVTRHYTWFPVPKHIVLEYAAGETRKQKMTDRGNRWTVENLVSNGPFKLTEWRFNNYIEITRNELYWDNENVWLNGVRFIPIANPYTEIRAYKAGQIHTTSTAPNELIPELKKSMPDQMKQDPYVGVNYLRFNTTVKALGDTNVRRALSLSINRKALVENLIYGDRIAESMTPTFGNYRAPKSVDFDPVLANKLLDEAGYMDRTKFPTLKFLSTSKESSRTITEAIQAMWKENLGITVSIENREWSSYLAAVQSMDYEISYNGWVGDYLDPTTFLFMWRKGGGHNLTGWSSAEFEAYLDEAATKGDPTERLATLEKAEERMMVDAPVAPLSWLSRNYLLHPSVIGWHPLLLDNHPYKAIRLEPSAPRK